MTGFGELLTEEEAVGNGACPSIVAGGSVSWTMAQQEAIKVEVLANSDDVGMLRRWRAMTNRQRAARAEVGQWQDDSRRWRK
jgi:hypothetical protein